MRQWKSASLAAVAVTRINKFRDDYMFLSNMADGFSCEFDGDVYPSVEHAYQAA